MSSNQRLAALLGLGVVAVIAGYLLLGGSRPPPARPASAAAAARATGRADTAPPPPPSASAEARRARDAMRAQILDALRARDAGALPPPKPAAQPAAAAPKPEPARPKGHYEASYIQEHFREDMFPLLKSCYESALKRKPALAGKLVLAFSIFGDPSVGGIVEEADFAEESTLKDDDMETCVRESLMTLTFDKPPTGGGYVTVRYPIDFSPGDDEEKDAAAE